MTFAPTETCVALTVVIPTFKSTAVKFAEVEEFATLTIDELATTFTVELLETPMTVEFTVAPANPRAVPVVCDAALTIPVDQTPVEFATKFDPRETAVVLTVVVFSFRSIGVKFAEPVEFAT